MRTGKYQNLMIELEGECRQKVDDLCDRYGMMQYRLLSRLVEWFLAQDELTQAICLGRFPPEIAPEVAKLLLKRMRPK